eukprot:119916-Alexandrium_andersonii.AAC.1
MCIRDRFASTRQADPVTPGPNPGGGGRKALQASTLRAHVAALARRAFRRSLRGGAPTPQRQEAPAD